MTSALLTTVGAWNLPGVSWMAAEPSSGPSGDLDASTSVSVNEVAEATVDADATADPSKPSAPISVDASAATVVNDVAEATVDADTTADNTLFAVQGIFVP